MEMDMRRVMLRAALLKLAAGEAVAENVARSVENMASIYEEVDEIRHLRRSREETGWTKKALAEVGLVRLGNFSVQVKTKKGGRTISFTDGSTTLEFIFERKPEKLGDRLKATLIRTQGQNEQEQKAVADALVQSTILKAYGMDISPDELLLGTSAALRDYRLKCVQKTVPRQGALAFLGRKQKTMLYVT